jgi:esterase FrsA
MITKRLCRDISLAATITFSSFFPLANAQVMSMEGELLVSEGRIGGLIAATANRPIIETTLSTIKRIKGDGPGVWSYEWRQVGEYYESLGDQHAQQNNTEEALKNYKSALSLYGAGYLPGNYTTSERKSYERFRDVALKINHYLAHPFSVVEIPFEGKKIIAHLYLPKDVKKPPMVLYTGGTDGSKEKSYLTTQTLVAKGFAVVAFDLAGTGESMDWVARPDSHKLHKRVLDYFEGTGDYDFSRVGLLGGSFGGYYAVKMAAEDKRLKAVISHCGLVHSAFSVSPQALPAVLHSTPGAMIYSAIRRMGFDPDVLAEPGNLSAKAMKEFFDLADSFSLISQGIVGSDKKTIDIPLLIVNGTRDPVVSRQDIELVENAATDSETWLMGQAGHCAPNYMAVAKPDMLNWLVEKLNQSKRVAKH